jgi:hypothetical protein
LRICWERFARRDKIAAQEASLKADANPLQALTPTIPEGANSMVEANHSLQQVALRARLAQAAITLAHREAEKAVKQALQRQGLKPQRIARREISLAAREYLAAHPELIAEAKPIVEQWRREGSLASELPASLNEILKL